MASNRPGGQGLLDIWVARRTSADQPFGAPENLPPPINSAADDFSRRRSAVTACSSSAAE
jgi:hypothetical protein